MNIIIGLLLMALAVGYWQFVLRLREHATAAARQACIHTGLQFLDETVVCTESRISLRAGRPVLRRHYEFEFIGEQAARHTGRLVYMGTELTGVTLSGVQLLQ